MLGNISFNRFYNIDSEIRRMNPISKILCVIIFLILTFMSSSIEFNLILVLIVLYILCFSNIPVKVYLKIILSLIPFIVFIFLINFLCGASYNISIIFSIRLILIVLYSSVLTLTSTPSELVYGLEHVLSPLKIFKVPVHSLALILSLAIRFIPSVFENGQRIIKIYESKGISLKKLSFKLKLSYLKSLVTPMFVLSLKNSDELAETLALRLYNTNTKRSNVYIYSFNRMDIYMLSSHIMLILVLVMKGIY